MVADSVSLIVLVAALLSNTLSSCSAENVYCVITNATSCSFCPYNNHCASLSEYAQKAELYFTSNTTMVFLPGDHVLDRNITVANVTRLTMYGESSFSDNIATVVRNGSVGFSFIGMVDFSIYSLAFISYNRSWSYGSHPASNSALLLQSTQNAKLVNCSFHDNFGTALTVHNTSVTLEGISKFIHNQCACQSFSDSEAHACSITALNSTLTFTGNTCFHENTQATFRSSSYCAGAIWASASSLYFNGMNNFTGNSANGTKSVGGAIYAKNNSSLSFSGTSNFTHNSAEYGGAITTIKNVALTFTGTNNFINNSAAWGGAIYTYKNVALTFTGTNNFTNNLANNKGGAIYTYENAALTFSGTNNFINNSAARGGAIYTSYNMALTFTGTNNFINNSAGSHGGAIYTYENVALTFSGTNNFINNSANKTSGAIYTYKNVALTFSGTNNFINNSANNTGGAIYTYKNVALTFSGTNNFINNFINNSAAWGGAIYTSYNIALTFTGTNNFINNSAAWGGAIYTYKNVVLTFTGTNNFTNNLANNKGGAIRALQNVALTFNGTNNFINNSAGSHGGAILVKTNISLTFIGNSNFTNNSAQGDGGAIFTSTNILLIFTGTSNFSSNSAMLGGAISAIRNSTLTFDGANKFTNNGPTNNVNNGVSRGGAMYLAINSSFSVSPHTTVCLENNHANLGGAIYVYDVYPVIYCTSYIKKRCFFQLPGQNLSNGLDVQLLFKNNSADDAGSVLYGGAIDNCIATHGLDSYRSGDVFDMLFQYERDNTASSISSDPIYICSCENNSPNCSRSRYSIPSPLFSVPYSSRVYPGETFQFSVVAVGQRNGTVSSTVRGTVTSSTTKSHLLDYQYLQQTSNTCTKLNYTVFSLSQHEYIGLYPEGSPCYYKGKRMYWLVKLHQTCPPGFNISESAKSCVCEPRLTQYTNSCNITNGVGRITRESGKQFWVGYDTTSHELILHPHCPFDYCVNDAVIFPLNNTDVQCTFNRSGLLCGRCKEGYSLVLGTHQCKKCTNLYLLLIIPFTLMGVALVIMLLACKLTVATGTLSGLALYANIVGVNCTIFLPTGSTDALSVFIAWLNLDFGIEICFYNGMDAYSKTWLQFVFPVYIWVLVGLMIFISHFSQKFANLLGSNPVSVLTTLILLSYAKILCTLIATVYFTHLEYPTYNRRVWLYDANIDYISGKHIPLFLVAVLVFFFLFLPYTLLLLFGQWLQAISHLRLFSWVNRLKPFMDSYHAPYKPKHRYWPGLLLVLRCVLLLAFAFNPQRNPNINILAILVGTGMLTVWAWASGGVYKNWCLDALEGSFFLNLIVLVGTTMYINVTYVKDQREGNQLAVGYTSVSIAFATFIGILAYHVFQQLRHTKLWKKAAKLNFKVKKLKTEQAVNNSVNDPTESANLDQLREPWLEDLL